MKLERCSIATSAVAWGSVASWALIIALPVEEALSPAQVCPVCFFHWKFKPSVDMSAIFIRPLVVPGAVKHAPHSFLDYISKICDIQDDKMSCHEHMGLDIQFVTPHTSSCPFRLSKHNEKRHSVHTSVVHLMYFFYSILVYVGY